MMSLPQLAVLAGIIIVAFAIFFHVGKKKGAANAATTNSVASSIVGEMRGIGKSVTGAIADLHSHISAVGTVLRTDIAKAAGSAPAAPASVEATHATLAPAATASASPDAPAAPSPAAPAPVTEAPPPAPVAAPPQPSGGSGTGWPQLVTVDGIKVMAFEPLNALWRASTMAHVMAKGGAGYVNDPSNGGLCVPPQPRRSADGYPLRYALGAGNAPVGAPEIVFGDMTFDSDAEVAAFLADEPARLAADDAAAQAAANRVLTGPVPASSLTDEDWKFAWWYSDQPGHGAWISATLSGPWLEIRQQLSIYGNNPGLLRHFDGHAYAGVLRQYVK